MKKRINFELLNDSYELDVEKPKGDGFFYMCEICRSILPSNPEGPAECSCGNIVLDPEMFKMSVSNYKKFKVLKRI